MQYKCRVVPLTKLIIGSKNIIRPLCDTCTSKDCENPIEKQPVSIMGVNEDLRVWNSRNTMGIVVNCEGYNP
jgi:hypothetical protein